jgi:2-keto-4-pentenoate hydratase/2-oxohepta-3-ene-1,7-dioic acid hydratase in catechol pathway
MKLLQFYEKQDEKRKPRIGVLGEGNIVRPLRTDGTMRPFIARLSEVEPSELELATWVEDAEGWPLEEVVLLSPLTDPEKIICIGLNYHDHVIESGMKVPSVPVLFPKYSNCIAAHEQSIAIPAEVTQCDYEVELAVVIGKEAKRVSREEAMDYVFGYTVLNDVSARDIQLNEPQWTRGKTIDGFAPIGPWIVTADELPHPGSLAIKLRLNGKLMQNSNTKELIFDIPYLISFLSNTMTLKPGDVISTGTPPGVGMGQKPQVWLKPGDLVEAEIEGIGVLRNTFVAEASLN